MSRTPSLRLVSLTDTEYAEFVALQVAETARERVTAGEWTAGDAPTLAWRDTAALRADLLRGAGHTFYRGVEPDGARGGYTVTLAAPVRI